MGSSKEWPERSNNDNTLRMRFCRRATHSPLPVAARLMVFTMKGSVSIQSYHRAGEKGMGLRQVKIPQHSLLFLQFSCFCWIIASWIAAVLGFTARVLKTWILTISVTPFIAFMEGETFGGPYSTIFTDITFMKDVFTGYKVMGWQFYLLAF